MNILHKIKIDLSRREQPERIDVVQGDSMSRTLEIKLYNNGAAYSVPESASILQIAYCKPDKTCGLYDELPSGENACTVAGNKVTAILHPQMFTAAGAVYCELRMLDERGTQLTTFKWIMNVAESVVNKMNSEDYYNFHAVSILSINNCVPNKKGELYLAAEDIPAFPANIPAFEGTIDDALDILGATVFHGQLGAFLKALKGFSDSDLLGLPVMDPDAEEGYTPMQIEKQRDEAYVLAVPTVGKTNEMIREAIRSGYIDTLEKVIAACCDIETTGGINYNLFKVSEVEFSARLQDDVAGTVSSNTSNAVTGWMPVEYGKYYCLSVLYEGSRTSQPGGAGSMWTRINVQKSDGSVVVYNRGTVPFASEAKASQQVVVIEHEDAVAMRIHFNVNSQDISTAELLKAYEPMFVEGDTAEEAYQNAINLTYIDGDAEGTEEVVYTLKHDKTKADKTDVEEMRNRLIGSMHIPADGSTIGSLVALDLAISSGVSVNSASTHGIVSDYIPCMKGSTVAVDSGDYTFQVMEYSEKGTPSAYSGVLSFGSTYTVTQNGYVRICIRYVDTNQSADIYLFRHLIANITGYYDFDTFARKADIPSSSPYYRRVNFGIIPHSYYRGVGDDYETKSYNNDTQYASFIADWKALVANHSSYVTETALGVASDGQTIYLYDFKPARIPNQLTPIPKIIIVAGQHGNEKANVFGWYYFIGNLLNRWNKHPTLEYLRNHVELMIVPVVNTYGFDHVTYKNANGVNINRNYDSGWVHLDDATSQQYGGAAPFDQPESQIIRDLILANRDALLVIDSHICDGDAADSFEKMTYYGVCNSTDPYYNRMLDVVAYQLSAVSANFNLDYELAQPDTIMGYLNSNPGSGILRSWATDNGFIGVLTEGFTGFPNGVPFTGEVFKANEEIVANYLVAALVYLAK